MKEQTTAVPDKEPVSNTTIGTGYLFDYLTEEANRNSQRSIQLTSWPAGANRQNLISLLARLLDDVAYVMAHPTPPARDDTNACIWRHWRAALLPLNDPSQPIPSGLTPEWRQAVVDCHASGVGSDQCCRAHVIAEQSAIDRCGGYDSSRFGPRPTDVPGAPTCSAGAALGATGLPFTGDFGDVDDRIN
jgi:hypothetical protein